MGERRFFTSESVTEGHPDKVCDAISDSVLDACLAQDPNSRVACETAVTTGLVMILGEITTRANIDFQQIARDAIREIGYTDAAMGFDADTCAVIVAMDKQSPDIAMGVDKAFEAKVNEFANERESCAMGASQDALKVKDNEFANGKEAAPGETTGAEKAAQPCAIVNESAAGQTEANNAAPAIVALENTLTEEEIEAIGAGDQGMMFGYATNQTPELMPYPISLASKLALQLSKVRKDGTLAYLRPDGKTQVSVEYDEDGKPARLEAVVVSTQHEPEISQKQIHRDIRKYVIDQIVPEGMIDEETKIYINPTGRFVIGGPQGDAGLTGRKIIVDTYGGYASHGGGAFSGKDPTKVDRSAAYAARYIAKNIVAAGLADEVQIEVSYAIGVAQPMSITVDTRGTGRLSNSRIAEIIRENFDLRPAGIIRMLDLRRPIYRATAAYGHFGRTDVELPWERTDKAESLRKYLD